MVSSSKWKARDQSSVGGFTETEFETQGFEPQDGDEELLWDVVAILAEKGNKYLIKWAGTDENGNPWPDSWVPRPDVTDDLVQAWKKEKALKKRERARGRAKARERKRQGSNVSRARTDSKRSSTTTLSTVTSRLTMRAASGSATEREGSATSIRLSSSVKKKRKQKFVKEEDDGGLTIEEDAPRKRRRLSKRDRDSQRSSPLKKPESRLTDTGDLKETVHNPKSRKQFQHGHEQEEEEDQGYDSTAGGNARPDGKALVGSERSRRTSKKVIRLEEEEDGEDGEDSVTVATPKTRREQQLQVEVVLPPSVVKSKSARDVVPDDSPDRLSVRRRRALSMSGSERASDDASIAPVHDQSKNRNGKTHKGPPGVRPADVKYPEGDGSAAEHEDDVSVTIERGHRKLSKDLSPPRESEKIVITSPSKLQKGLTVRMRGKEGRKMPDRERESSVQNSETLAVESARDEFDEPELAPVDDIVVYDYDALDDNLLTGKSDQPIRDHKPTVASYVNDKNFVTEGGDEDGLSGEPQSPKGAVVPSTQSQSQSQDESQRGVSDDLQLASILAEHGSVPQQADSLRAETLLIPTSSVTDPQPSAETNVKTHKKIPVVTPSKFKPYLQQQKPLSALPLPHLVLHSMEDYSDIASQSPLKNSGERTAKRSRSSDHVEYVIPTGEDTSLADMEDIEDEMPHSLELQQRGLELAEMRRRKLREEIQKPVSRISLHELLAKSGESSRSGTPSGGRSEESNPSTPNTTRKMIDPDGAEETTLEAEIDEARIHQFEEAFIDFDGNSGNDPQASRETAGGEEERRAAAVGDTSEEADAADVESSLQDVVDENDPFLSHGEVTEGAITPTTTSSDQDDAELYTPVKRRFKILGSPTKLESPLLRTPSQQLNEAMGLLHAKSEEIEHLKRELEDSTRKRLGQDNALAEIQAENAVLKKTIEDRVVSKELDEELVQQCKDKEVLGKEILARDAEIRLLKMNWDDAVKQAEVFRESYERASAFADETKERNAELEERARLAEAQVKSGLNLYRKQYDARIEKLEMELERQRIEAHIIKTRDTRTDDEVRRRAALEPELREQIDSLGEEIRDLKIAQGNIVRQRNELLVENQDLKNELEELRSSRDRAVEDLTWSEVQVARLMAREKAFKKVFLTNSVSILEGDSDHAEEKVFVCKWMSGFDGRTRCNSLFTNVQELKDHLFVDHQL